MHAQTSHNEPLFDAYVPWMVGDDASGEILAMSPTQSFATLPFLRRLCYIRLVHDYSLACSATTRLAASFSWCSLDAEDCSEPSGPKGGREHFGADGAKSVRAVHLQGVHHKTRVS